MKFNIKAIISISILIFASVIFYAYPQSWNSGDIAWIKSTDFIKNIDEWSQTGKINEDDNFFISRVKPKKRIFNPKTQINENLINNVNDKRLIAWLPFNSSDYGNMNGLPTGKFDSECFTMWSYIDHWGNWSSPLGALPGAFTDIAHKNGVSVSSLANIPFGELNDEWYNCLKDLKDYDPKMIADFLFYYGSDGIGYNSEFTGFGKYVAQLQEMHEQLLKHLNQNYKRVVEGYEGAEIIWYDATDINGVCRVDRGLDYHNIDIWGQEGHERSSLFFNYNWNTDLYLNFCRNNINELAPNRNPLYIYCGINMQGGEPKGLSWPLLKDYNFSIGLWGAHSENMFWLFRGESGSDEKSKQSRYQYRIENWFSGGNHNPVNTLEPESITLCNGNDKNFHGMSYFMSARSSLSWDLSEEPFISYFNVGNGLFFNWKGERQNNNEWYNIGVQDYLPTWRWWFSGKFLGKNINDLVANGLKANFTWDDAYVGGSCLNISGSVEEEYLHLFKTSFDIVEGDEITVCYKVQSGKANLDLIFSSKGKESQTTKQIKILSTNDSNSHKGWIKKTYRLKANDILNCPNISIIGLKFTETENFDLLLGEISIKRGIYPQPVTPEAPEITILRNTISGIDAKLIFNVPNDKPKNQVCYNSDVHTSFFKFWSQEEGKNINLLGITTSWAAMAYRTPFEGNDENTGKIRFGISATSLDTDFDTEIRWSDYVEVVPYEYCDLISLNKTPISIDDEFELKAEDKNRKFKWKIYKNGERISPVDASETFDNSWVCDGINEEGIYDVEVIDENEKMLYFENFIVISDPSKGQIPNIKTLLANGKEENLNIMVNENIEITYEGCNADGNVSRALAIKDNFFGCKIGDIFKNMSTSFTIAGWLKIDTFNDVPVNFINIVKHDDAWPSNNYGWLCSSINSDGTLQNLDFDFYESEGEYIFGSEDKYITDEIRYKLNPIKLFNAGKWAHFALTIEKREGAMRVNLFINGKKINGTWNHKIYDYYGTEIKETEDGAEDDFIHTGKDLDSEYYLSIGGTRHPGRGVGGNSFKGYLDDLQIWSKVMTNEEIALSMKGLDKNNLPSSVECYWDFEDDPENGYILIPKGSNPDAKAFQYLLEPLENEGQSKVIPVYSEFGPGSPLIIGNKFKITTRPWLKCENGIIEDFSGTDKEGKINLKFDKPTTDESFTLYLVNEYGQDEKTFRFINVFEEAGIETINDEKFDPIYYQQGDSILLRGGKDGFYKINLFSVSGEKLYQVNKFLDKNELFEIPQLNKGIIMIHISCDEKYFKNLKIIKR